MCRHFDMNSDLLLNMCTSSRFIIMKAFSLRLTIVYRADVTNNKTVEHKYYYDISDTDSKNVMKIIKRLSDIDHTRSLQICLSITGN